MADALPALRGDWRITGLVAVAVGLPLLVVARFEGHARPLHQIALESGLIAYLTLFAAAVSVYFAWRVTRDNAMGWMAAAMCLSAVQGIALLLRARVDPEGVLAGADWQIVVHTTVVVAVVLLALAAGRRPVVLDPIALGILGGAAFVLARWGLTQSPQPLDLPDAATVAFRVLVGLACVCLVVAIMIVPRLPGWVRVRMAGVVVLLGTAYQLTFPLPEGDVRCGIACAAHMLAGVVVGSTAFALLRAVLATERSERSVLRDRLDRLESIARLDRARLHEVGATIAGIHSASHLLDTKPDLSPSTRASLTTMLRDETARLERLLANRPPAVPSIVEVDRAVGPVVERQVATGQHVSWTPSGLRVWARHDELAEVVSILLDNAARHAPRAHVVVRAVDTGGHIEIEVTDAGPGVAEEHVERLFDWGWSGDRSSGQGIGLAIARQLLEDVGGWLRHEHARPGSRFVLGLSRVTSGAGAAEE
jgi:signal transduction histidine kinase